MSTKYFCDACGKEVTNPRLLTTRHIGAHERKGSGSIGDAWYGDLCGDCLSAISYEEDTAAYKEIKRIQNTNKT